MKIKSMSISKKKSQLGLALADFGLWLVLGAIVTAGAMGLYLYSKSSVNADNFAEKTILMVSDIQKHWSAVGSYTSVTPAEVNKLSVIRPPLKYDGTNIVDVWGNTMALTGNASSFALTVGGSTVPLQQDECASIVGRLAPVATSIRIGADAEAAAGVITGGTVYKNGSTVSQTGLTTGCSAASPKIAAQFR